MHRDQSMASTQPTSACSPPRKRARLAAPAGTDASASNGDLLPTNELQEVLLRLPSKTLGRLRGVCRGWRSMLSDPLFVAAHTSRCQYTTDSLLVVAVHHAAEECRVDVNLVDMSTGAVVRRLDGLWRGSGSQHLCAGGGLLCSVTAGGGVVHVLDPATGATTDHPGHTEEHERRACTTSSYTLGHVPGTGEHKVLHITDARGEQSCEVFTIGGGSHGQRWRPTQSPPMRVESSASRRTAIVHGMAYFLPSHLNGRHLGESDSVAAFDLATEEWRPAPLRGPLRSRLPEQLSLAEMDDRLTMVHLNYRNNSMDMYALITDDSETEKEAAWSMTRSLRLDSVLRGRDRERTTHGTTPVQVVRRCNDRETVARPLAALDDGRIALWVAGTKGNVVRVYDARTETRTEVVELKHNCSIVGFYRGSLLGLHGR